MKALSEMEHSQVQERQLADQMQEIERAKGMEACCLYAACVSGPQKGPVERGHVKKHQKSRTFFNTFRPFRARQNCQKVSNIFFHTFRQFLRGTNFPARFGGL